MSTSRELMAGQMQNAIARFGATAVYSGQTVSGRTKRLDQMLVTQDPGLLDRYMFSLKTLVTDWTTEIPPEEAVISVTLPDGTAPLTCRVLRVETDSLNLNVTHHLGSEYQNRERPGER